MGVLSCYLPISIKIWGVDRGEYYTCEDLVAFPVCHCYQWIIMHYSGEALTDHEIHYSVSLKQLDFRK